VVVGMKVVRSTVVGPTGSSGQVLHEEVHRVLELLWRDSGVHAPLDVEALVG